MQSNGKGLVVVARNGQTTERTKETEEFHPPKNEVGHKVLAEEIEIEQKGWPRFKFFEGSTKSDLEAQVEHWIELYGINPVVDAVTVMSPTVSADGIWQCTVNYLLFEDNVDP